MIVQHWQTIVRRRRKQSVSRPGAWSLGTAVCSFVLNAATIVVIARTLGPTNFGVYMFVLWLATAAVPAIGVGMSTVTSRYLASIQGREEPRLIAGIFRFVWQRQYRSILLYCFIYLLLAWPLSWFFGAKAPVLFLLLAGLSALPILLSGVASITLRSLHRFDLLAVLRLVGASTSLLLVFMATQFQGEQTGMFLLASAITSTLTLMMALFCILCLLPMKQAVEPGMLLQDRLTRGLSNSLLLFILDSIVWQRSEMLLLGHGHNTAELGFYALSSLISARVIGIAPTILSTCILPLLLRYMPGQHYVSAADAFLKTSRHITLLAVPLCLGAILCCPILISWCFGDAYFPIVTPLRILLVSAMFGSVATISLTHLAQGERKRAQLRLGIVAALINILLAVPLIAFLGVTGAALASAIAQIVSAIGSICICRKLILG